MVIQIDNLNINYKITGDGPENFVILQGWGTDCDIYDSVARCVLASAEGRFRVIQFDLPGFGGSDELEIKKATLYGHSFGGRIIIKLLNKKPCPIEVTKIILNDAAGIMPKRSPKQLRKIKRYKILKKILMSKPVHALFPDMIDYWASVQGSADYRAASPMMKKCLVKAVNEDLTDLLQGIDKDTLLVWGDKDTATPIEDAHTMEKLIPNAGLAVIEGVGHYSFIENAPMFNSILSTYLRNS